jgi:hypothetical protein
MIFDCAPKTVISRSFGLVKEVVVTSRSYSMAFNPKMAFNPEEGHWALRQSLEILASRDDLSNPLHVTFHPCYEKADDSDKLYRLLAGDSSPPIIYIIRDLPYHDLLEFSYTLHRASDFGAMLQFSTPCWRCQDLETTNCNGDFVKDLAEALGIFTAHDTDTRTDDGPLGQMILCDVSQLILNSHELVEAAEEANKAAQLKIFKLLYFSGAARQWSDAQKWDRYTSRVKFVDSGFSPSEADLVASVKRRSVVILLHVCKRLTAG